MSKKEIRYRRDEQLVAIGMLYVAVLAFTVKTFIVSHPFLIGLLVVGAMSSFVLSWRVNE